MSGREEVFDVAAAAAAKFRFSKVLDATGTLPDRVLRDSVPRLLDAVTAGRPVEELS